MQTSPEHLPACNVKTAVDFRKTDDDGMIQTSENWSATPISDFYQNSTILITGGTGFIGKVLIHKLLRTFKLRRIYLLIRVKDNMNVNQRLQSFFQESIFDSIHTDCPELFAKVYPIHANFSAIDLDISAHDRAMLRDEVEIVFNVVASVKFNEKLRDAVGINVLGTKKILDLVMEMKHLKAFLHISTLYSNCNRKFINERVYEADIGYEKIIQLTRILDDGTMKKLQHCLIGEMPNTYTMTKRCSENLVNHRAFFLPAGIFRPPIVLSTYKEPYPGWTDNLYGPSGLCAWSARGLIRCIYGDGRKKANLVPVDYCINAMIAVGWDVATRFKERRCEQSELPVYNYIFDSNNLTWGEYMHLARKGFHEPFDKALWYFSYVIVPSKPLHRLATFLLHNIPGHILDLIATATGQQKIYSKGYRKMAKVIDMMSYFGLREWDFSNRNIVQLDNQLGSEERKLLPFNMATINWTDYFRHYLSGIRKYFFKDKTDKLTKRKNFYRWMYVAHVILKSAFGALCLFGFAKILSFIYKIIARFKSFVSIMDDGHSN